MNALLSLLLAANALAAGRASAPLGNGQVANNSVDTDKLQADAVTGVKIINAGVATAKLDTDAVTGAKVLNAAISTPKLATDAVSEAKILDTAVSTNKLATDSVNTNKLLTDSVTGTKILNASVSTDKLASGAVTAGKLNLAVRTCTAGQAVTSLSASDAITCEAFGSSSLGGSGSANTVAKWTAATTLGNSLIADDGVQVTIADTTKFTENAGAQTINTGWNSISGASGNNGSARYGSATNDTLIFKIEFEGGGTEDAYLTNNVDSTGADVHIETRGSGTKKTLLTVSGDGFVGINNTAPTVILDVIGSAKISTVGNGTARALCMNASNIMSTCTSAVGADGTCTCQN